MIGANCYLLVSDQHRAAIIDPGGEAARLEAWLTEQQVTPAMILLTHGHHDHLAAVWDLVKRYEIPVYVHEADAEMLQNIALSLCGMTPLYFTYQPGADIRTVADGDTITLDEITIRVLHTPGHSKGSCCLEAGGALFTGDTLFAGSVGRTDLYGGSWQTLRQSLHKLTAYPPETPVFPGHGGSSTIGRERKTNPYLE